MECTLPVEVEAYTKAAASFLASDIWTLSVYGASNERGSGAWMILASPNNIIMEQALHFIFRTSNNKMDYEVLLVGLRLAREIGA